MSLKDILEIHVWTYIDPIIKMYLYLPLGSI